MEGGDKVERRVLGSSSIAHSHIMMVGIMVSMLEVCLCEYTSAILQIL